jgi:hypothetical protein
MSELQPANLSASPAPQPSAGSGQLLPPQFFARRHTRRVFCVWFFVVVSLSAAMIGVLTPVWLRGKQIRNQNARMIAESQPLSDLRRKTQLQEVENTRQAQWSQWVESAKPDDSLLQTMAAIAVATKPAESGIEIESLEIHLPLEYPADFQQPPSWAAPRLSLTAHVNDGLTVRAWLDRINASDRIDDARSKLTPGTWQGSRIQIDAKPRSTCVLP